jgi:hypothetical protein
VLIEYNRIHKNANKIFFLMDNEELTRNRGWRGRENARHFPHSGGKAAAPAQQGVSGRMILG